MIHAAIVPSDAQKMERFAEQLLGTAQKAKKYKELLETHGELSRELSWYKKHYVRHLCKQIRALGGKPDKLSYKKEKRSK